MFPHTIVFAAAAIALATSAPAQPPQPPQVKVNVLNVCQPSADERKELTSALEKVPPKPLFGADFEVARGHSVLDQSTTVPGMPALPAGTVSTADWVRVRRDFPDGNIFSNVQYSFSVDATNMVETLVLRMRDPKDVMEVSIEDSASAVTSATAMLSSRTPVSRVKLERFGKSSVVLSRCNGAEGDKAADQSAYEPIFDAASAVMQRYRGALGARKIVPQELAHLRVATSAASSSSTSARTGTSAKDSQSKKNP